MANFPKPVFFWVDDYEDSGDCVWGLVDGYDQDSFLDGGDSGNGNVEDFACDVDDEWAGARSPNLTVIRGPILPELILGPTISF